MPVFLVFSSITALPAQPRATGAPDQPNILHSLHVPLILAGQGIPKNKTTDAFAYLFDLFPTLCQYVGVPHPTGVDGQSLLPVIRGKAQSVRPFVMHACMDHQRSLPDDRYKLIRYPRWTIPCFSTSATTRRGVPNRLPVIPDISRASKNRTEQGCESLHSSTAFRPPNRQAGPACFDTPTLDQP